MAVDTLRAEHESIQRAVAASRRKFSATADSVFARTMMNAIDEYLKMRTEGVEREDALRGLEGVLRECWLKPPSKFPPVCDECFGTGYREMTCWDQQRCQREPHAHWNPALEHAYVVLCSCGSGDRFRPPTHTPDDAIVSVGRGKKPPRGWSGIGR